MNNEGPIPKWPIPVKCDWCPKPSVTKWREGRGTGHSESVYACEDHKYLETAE